MTIPVCWLCHAPNAVCNCPPITGATQLLIEQGDSANARQVGGDHYKGDIEPWDAIAAWKLGFLAGNIVKYIARYKRKGGVEDLNKARHYLDKLIEQGGEE